MKTVRKIILGLILAFTFFSCDNPVNLGTMLDLSGPVINFTSPAPRKAVTASFMLEGTAFDESGINLLIIKVEKDRVELPRQWRYSNGNWESSENSGVTWTPLSGCVWEGDKSVVWGIPVNLTINGKEPEDGEYLFYATAWDKGGVSDDNSFKTLILIIDNDPPKVSISRPLLYDRHLSYNSVTDEFSTDSDDGIELEMLRNLDTWQYPEHINKFQTSSFPIQWGIEDNFSIWSFDLRFYTMDVEIDENKDTPLPDNYIYRYHQNDINVMPDSPSPSDYVKPNGTVDIPSLETTGNFGDKGEVKKQITDRTTIRVVSVCYDAANNVTQEKTLGFFVYWPQADIPWINFSGDIKPPENYNTPGSFATNVEKAFLVYPGVSIKAVAFHAQGIQSVTYSISKINEPLTSPYSANSQTPLVTDETLINGQSARGKFDWEFKPEPRSAYYVVTATTLSTSGKTSDPISALFRVQDITFPDFPQPIQPPELEPLFRHIDKDSITISGVVSDATEIDTLCLVWINPQSKNAAANAQLEYFRDQEYAGWKQALKLSKGATGIETAAPEYGTNYPYDSSKPNRFWNLIIVPKGINPLTQRVEYTFSKTIPLADLNIGGNDQPLRSQIFLLRAANKNPRVTIITYTPQGDESPPVIEITNAVVQGGTFTPGAYGQLKKFNDNDIITINGTWSEDSTGYLPFDTYLKNNFKISVNQTVLTELTFPVNNGSSGTWKAVATVKENGPWGPNVIPLAKLKDTLVVAADLTDIGNNHSDHGAAWLIESDTLRLSRISSEDADQAYNALKTIRIFLEFNKPVKLKSGRANPSLILRVGSNTTITAAYDPIASQNTRQYFTYTVAAGQNTTTAYPYLDVIGLSGTLTGNYWELPTYPFTWEAVSATSKDEIRITMNASHTAENDSKYTNTNALPDEAAVAILRRLPVAANSADLPYTLAQGKNISIDTTGPTVSGISSSNKAGHYALGSVIEINVKFSEPVKIDTPAPQLRLQLSGKTVDTTGTPRVNNDTVSFSYTVVDGDTTGDNKLTISSFIGGPITDIAGTNMTAYTFNATNGALNGGTSNNGTGIYVNTVAPGVPTFRALKSSTNTDTISNNINGTPVTGESGSLKDLKNYYGKDLYFAIIGNTTGGNNRVGYFEYTLDPSTVTNPILMNWKRIDNETAFKQDVYGKYYVRARQIDKAGNPSPVSTAVSLNWDPDDLVTRIDSTSPNGEYTNNSNVSTDKKTITINVYFRKQLNVTGTPVITLNAIRGTGTTKVTVDGSAANTSQLNFTYNVGTTDNTPNSGTSKLDVDAITIASARDSEGVDVSSYIKLPNDTADRLASRKDIKVITSALALDGTNPVYSFTNANDEATGTIKFTFNRDILKNEGEISITQETAGYRLPAVLTEAQANRYKGARGFNTYYSRGTNGAVSGAVDTSTKYVLRYDQTTVVEPNDTGTDPQILAFDFLKAEKVTLSVSSQDVTVSGKTLTINLTGSNALQVLGAVYDIVIPAGLVQDSLSYRWPSTASYTTSTSANTVPGINRPFVRVDKKINEDRITAPGNGGAARPHLLADFSRLIQTRARLDCRTPGSIVRYKAAGAEHTADQANSLGSGPQNPATTPGTPANYYWKNTSNNADNLTNLNGVASQDTDSGTGTTYNYDNFTGNTSGIAGTANITHITVGTNTEEGYVWRIGVKSRNGTGGSNNSALYEEIAFRTVLTYELLTVPTSDLGQRPGAGDQLWIRGGDAIGSSSLPNFPLNWQDNFGKLSEERKRAGIRLLRFLNTTAPTNIYTATNWRYITWEINVQTFHDVVLGRGTDTATAQDKDDAWQFGPRQWAYQRGGWSALKEQYTLNPGKHRWCRITGQGYDGGSVNFSLQFSIRGTQTLSYQQPNP